MGSEPRIVDDRDAEIAGLKRQVHALEADVKMWRKRAFYAEGDARQAHVILPRFGGHPC